MSERRTSSAFALRNYPDDDALQNPHQYSKAISFSPDIIPTYGTTPDKGGLLDPASWRGFTGFPIVGGDINNVYIRGYGSGGPYIASLWVVPSELILWPHVWQSVKPVPSGPVVIPGGNAKGRYISDAPLHFRPPHNAGNTYSLVANVSKHVPGKEESPKFDLEHFGVDDFASFLSKDDAYTFYNVIVADPTLRHVSATTRLRMIGNLPVLLAFRLEWHKGSPVPHGLEVSLVDDRGKIVIPRIPFSLFGERPVLVEPTYDGILMLNIFSPAENPNFEPYSGLALQVLKSGLPSPTLLGALNIIFEPHSSRNIRFASPAAKELRESKKTPGEVKSKSSPSNDSGPIPATNPATGWWTRAVATDTNTFPHSPIGICPDIQPVGTDPNKQNFVTILQNPALDYSATNNIELVGNANNYIYMRGHSTLADIDVQSRLFAVNTSTANYPSQYLTQGIKALVLGSKGTVNEQSISVANPNQFYLFERPFVISNPPQDSTNHYCLIGEVRQKRKTYPVYPGWPSDDWDNYATLADFEVYCLSNPLMSWRNINWEPGSPGSNCWVWSCSTQLCIPDASSYCTFFTIILECDNVNIPAKSTWKLVCDDNEIFGPDGTCFDTCPISTTSPARWGCHFTGARPGYKKNLSLTVTWCDGGDSTIPLPSIQWKLMETETLISPIVHLANDAPPGSEAWPLYVTQDYPYIGSQPNPSPLPTFKSAGVNTWPYKGAMQFQLGQVSLSAKRA